MGKPLPQWCIEARKAMLDKGNMTGPELAKKIGVTRQQVSGVLNGRVYSKNTIKLISDELNISDSGFTFDRN